MPCDPCLITIYDAAKKNSILIPKPLNPKPSFKPIYQAAGRRSWGFRTVALRIGGRRFPLTPQNRYSPNSKAVSSKS